MEAGFSLHVSPWRQGPSAQAGRQLLLVQLHRAGVRGARGRRRRRLVRLRVAVPQLPRGRLAQLVLVEAAFRGTGPRGQQEKEEGENLRRERRGDEEVEEDRTE